MNFLNLYGIPQLNDITMSDTMTPEQRSRCMAAIHSKDTKPEVLVRKFLFAKGLRFRVCNRKLPGSPDIVLPKYQTVIFIDGCFWHGHEGCKHSWLPQTNTEFWKSKILTNKTRDTRNDEALMAAGWKIIRIWECEIRTKTKREAVLENLYNHIIGNLQKPKPYTSPSIVLPLAAEPAPLYGHFSIKRENFPDKHLSLTIIERKEADIEEN